MSATDREKVAKRRPRKPLRQSEIERTLRHAQATRRTEHDSWLNAYQSDVAWMISELEILRG